MVNELQSVFLPCPRCGTLDSRISVSLWNLSKDESDCFTCKECDRSFDRIELYEFMAKWTPFLAWLEQIPQPGENEETPPVPGG